MVIYSPCRCWLLHPQLDSCSDADSDGNLRGFISQNSDQDDQYSDGSYEEGVGVSSATEEAEEEVEEEEVKKDKLRALRDALDDADIEATTM